MKRESSDDMSKPAASGGDAKHDVASAAWDMVRAVEKSDDPLTIRFKAPRNFRDTTAYHPRELFKQLMEYPPPLLGLGEGRDP
jgi:hypothetical protein